MENRKSIFTDSLINENDSFFNNMKKMKWFCVDKKRRNSRKGSMDIKTFIYKDIYDPRKIKPKDQFNEDDELMLKRYLAMMDMESKIKSFLPRELLIAINKCSNAVDAAFDNAIVYKGMNYMTKKNLNAFLKKVQKEYESLQNIMVPYLGNWEQLVIQPFIENTVKVLFPEITEDDLNFLVKKIPTAQVFEASYRNYYHYEVTPIQQNVKSYEVTNGSLEIRNANQILKDNVEYIISSVLGELMGVSCRAYEQFNMQGKLASRTNAYLKEAPTKIKDIISFMGNPEIDVIINKAFDLKNALESRDVNSSIIANNQLMIRLYQVIKHYGLDQIEGLPEDVNTEMLEAMLTA